MEKYSSYRELRMNEKEGEDYRINWRIGRSGIMVMAPHGGDTEPGTTEIADAVAGEEHTFYSFDGLKRYGNSDLHITSACFDEPTALELAKDSETILAIHGCKGEEKVIYVGGRNRHLKEKVKKALVNAGFPVREALRFPGANPQNICNQSRTKSGVQLEISTGLRKSMLKGLSRSHRKITTELFEKFVSVLKGALSEEQIKRRHT